MSVTVAAGRHALETLRLAQELESTGATPTPEQAQMLASWTGWGILSPAFAPQPEGSWATIAEELLELLDPVRFYEASTSLDVSFFTPPALVEAVWSLLGEAGFTGGRVLEPGSGTGAFLAGAPAHLTVDFHGIERDSTSAAIAAMLHPQAKISNKALQDVHLRADSYDAVIGNFPFASGHIWDSAGFSAGSLHEYFLRRSLAALRPGGYLAVLTSAHYMDSDAFARLAHDGGQFVAAIRLPEEAFAEAGAQVVSDLLILRKAPTGQHGRVPTLADFVVEGATHKRLHGWWGEHPELVVGEFKATGFYQRPVTVRCDDLDGALAAALTSAAGLVADMPMTTGELIPVLEVEAVNVDGIKEGSYQIVSDDGVEQIIRVVDGTAEPVARPSKKLRALIELRDAAVALLEAESDTSAPDASLDPLRTRAREVYTAYVAKNGPLNAGTLHEGKEDPETGLPALTWRPVNLGGFRSDPDFHLVAALEVYDQDSGPDPDPAHQQGPGPDHLRRDPGRGPGRVPGRVRVPGPDPHRGPARPRHGDRRGHRPGRSRLRRPGRARGVGHLPGLPLRQRAGEADRGPGRGGARSGLRAQRHCPGRSRPG